MSERDRLVDARDRMARAAGQDDPSAVRLLREAIDLDPSLREAYGALGRLYYRNAWLEAELDLWLQRIGVDPMDADAHERIGWILWFTGRAEESLPWLERNLTLRPSGKWGRFYMGNAHLILGRYVEAERAYRAAIEAHPDFSSAHAGLAWTLFAAGRVGEARAQCDRMRATTLDGDRYEVKMADLDLFSGEATTAAERARRVSPEDARAWPARYWPRGTSATTILAGALIDRDYRAAAAALTVSESVNRSRLLNGDEGYLPRYDLAAVYALYGNRDEACRWLTEAIAVGWWFPDLARRDPLLRSLHECPPFEDLLKKRPAPHGRRPLPRCPSGAAARGPGD
ncbi:MAG: tetratricopeptide repeat protein [Candidatus Rokubacteria bacterium]|nr:tetratricopeptide repeat protein [Candidatus Rokubacteria bacterium]